MTVNDAGNVHVYVTNFRLLPEEELNHWRAYNVRCQADLSELAIARDIQGDWTRRDPPEELVDILRRWHDSCVAWWKIPEPVLLEQVRTPLGDNRTEWADAFVVLSRLVVEGLRTKTIRKKLAENSIPYEDSQQSLSLIELLLRRIGMPDEGQRLVGLKVVQQIRSKYSHATGRDARGLAKRAFEGARDLCESLQACLPPRVSRTATDRARIWTSGEQMTVESDNHLVSAGECFMSLCWVESAMRDFVVLYDGGEDMRARYNRAYGSDKLPSDFSRHRLSRGISSFSRIKDHFLDAWPEWRQQRDVHEAIERTVIWRNAFAHAQVQPYRPYLLHTPDKQSWMKIRRYTKCHTCLEYHKDCQCPRDEVADPRTIIMRCLDKEFLKGLYDDIKTVDVRCFSTAAKALKIRYRGLAWPTRDGYMISRHHPD